MGPNTNESTTTITTTSSTDIETTMSIIDDRSSNQTILLACVVVLTVFALTITSAGVTAQPTVKKNTSTTTIDQKNTPTPTKNKTSTTTKNKNKKNKKKNTPTPIKNKETHTLVIKTTGEPVRYVVSASSGIAGETAESDSIQGTRLSGNVGGVPWKKTSNDTTDVIKYIGYIETFRYQGEDIQLILDGRQISPEILSGHHMKISYPNNTETKQRPINYQVNVTGQAIRGESAEKRDTTNTAKTNNTTIRGRLTDDMDSFYFTGNVSSSSFDERATVFFNGRQISELKKKTPTPRPTPTANEPPTTQTTVPETESTPMTETTTEFFQTTTGVNSSGASSNTDGSSNIAFLLSLVGGAFVVVALVFVAFWYFRPRHQRW